MDDLAKFNRERWNALVQAGIVYSRPFFELDEEKARQEMDPTGIMGDIHGKEVLCLGGGGGQQSAAFMVLGARVTVFDLSDEQLAKDRLAARHYGKKVRTEQGDMRDLSRFSVNSFDVIWQPYSINFIPDVRPVFREVNRLLRPGGLYRLECANPFAIGIDENQWIDKGYPIRDIYRDGEMTYASPNWQVWHVDGSMEEVPGPREFRHTFSTLFNNLIKEGFMLLGFWEDDSGDPEAEPGTWDHFKAIAPPYVSMWWRKK